MKHVASALTLALLSTVAVAVPAAAQTNGGDKKILMALWSRETEYEIAFKERLAELGVKATYTIVLGEQARGTMATRLRTLEPDFAAKNFDLIYSWGTTATEIVKGLVQDRIPTVFNVVYDPTAAKLVASNEAPGGSITGVTNGVPIERQFDTFSTLVKMSKLCFLFNAREQNANLTLGRLEKWSAGRGITLTALRSAPDTPALDDHLRGIEAGTVACDAVYAGADSYLGAKAEEIAHKIGTKVELLGGTARFVQQGWLAALAPEVKDMGFAAADLAAKILAGQAPATLPVTLPDPKLIVNKQMAERHGVTVPAGARVITGQALTQ